MWLSISLVKESNYWESWPFRKSWREKELLSSSSLCSTDWKETLRCLWIGSPRLPRHTDQISSQSCCSIWRHRKSLRFFYHFCEEIDVKSAKTRVLVYQVYRPDGWCYIKPIFVISTLLKHLTGNIQYLRQWDSSFAQVMMIISDWASDGSKLRSDHAES